MHAPDLASAGPRPTPTARPEVGACMPQAKAKQGGAENAGAADLRHEDLHASQHQRDPATEPTADFEAILAEHLETTPFRAGTAAPTVEPAAEPIAEPLSEGAPVLARPPAPDAAIAKPADGQPITVVLAQATPEQRAPGSAQATRVLREPAAPDLPAPAPAPALAPAVAPALVPASAPAAVKGVAATEPEAEPEPQTAPRDETAPPAPRSAGQTPVATPVASGVSPEPRPMPLVASPQTGTEGLVAAGTGGSWRLDPEPSAPLATSGATVSVQAQAVAGQITLAIGRATDRVVEIRLDPPELGRVQIQLTTTEAGLQAVVMAERPETQDLLRRHAELLARELGAAGFRNVSLDFAAGGQSTPDRREAPAENQSLGVESAQLATAQLVTAPGRATLAGALDIRL